MYQYHYRINSKEEVVSCKWEMQVRKREGMFPSQDEKLSHLRLLLVLSLFRSVPSSTLDLALDSLPTTVSLSSPDKIFGEDCGSTYPSGRVHLRSRTS